MPRHAHREGCGTTELQEHLARGHRARPRHQGCPKPAAEKRFRGRCIAAPSVGTPPPIGIGHPTAPPPGAGHPTAPPHSTKRPTAPPHGAKCPTAPPHGAKRPTAPRHNTKCPTAPRHNAKCPTAPPHNTKNRYKTGKGPTVPITDRGCCRPGGLESREPSGLTPGHLSGIRVMRGVSSLQTRRHEPSRVSI
ncbi:unnamed protein product [Lampetra fluviatilis]